jgi:ABC-type nitrate/sulfonate/bicarbonate transport system ATPase subunit
MSMRDGEFLGLLDRFGCGKSRLLRRVEEDGNVRHLSACLQLMEANHQPLCAADRESNWKCHPVSQSE